MKSGIIKLVEIIKGIEALCDRCYSILKLDIHGLCFAYLLNDTKKNFNMQQEWLISRNYQTFFREFAIYIEAFKEIFGETKSDNINVIILYKFNFYKINIKLLSEKIIFDDLIFLISKIFKNNILGIQMISHNLAMN